MMSYIIFVSSILLLLVGVSESSSSASYDSIISSQCKARCLSLYPWRLLAATTNSSALNRLLRSQEASKHHQHHSRHRATNGKRYTNQTDPSSNNNNNNIKWSKVMELCSKNPHCLQCSLPCEIPTNLLKNCKFLCKNQHPYCIDSCDLLIRLNEEKYGSCPIRQQAQHISPSLTTFESSLPPTDTSSYDNTKCSNVTKSLAITALLRQNFIDDSLLVKQPSTSSSSQRLLTPIECHSDSDCPDTSKCCQLNPECSEHGQVCQRPYYSGAGDATLNLPSIPFNLTITERKKGKTVILSWDSIYNKNKPTMFVIEGRWSLKSPYSISTDVNSGQVIMGGDVDSSMTEWGYLASTVNTNWVILRTINRGRWYKFRVGAVSKHGSFGYSQPTELFILSSPPKPPTQPQNLNLLRVYEMPLITSDSATSNAVTVAVNADVSWLAPKRSDLPVTEYKLSWRIQRNREDDSQQTDDEFNDYSVDKTGGSKFGYEIIDTSVSDQLSQSSGTYKFTIRHLLKNSIYVLEVTAIAKHDGKKLVSSPVRLKLDTNQISSPMSSQISSALPIADGYEADDLDENADTETQHAGEKKTDYDEDSDDYDGDESETASESPQRLQSHSNRQQSVRNSEQTVSIEDLNTNRQPAVVDISNLSVQTPYFQNGLVKAKLSWQLVNSDSSTTPPMFTLTWFPVKCHQQQPHQSSPYLIHHKQLPAPITASTINTHFEIYELRFDCEYTINIKLASSQQTTQTPTKTVSVQFKVPSCSAISIIGRIKPFCYEASATASKSSIDSSTVDSVTKPSMIETTVTTTPTTTTTTRSLPRVHHIKYKLLDKIKNLYSIEFTWATPRDITSFSGYQISVTPRRQQAAVQSHSDSAGVYFGSVGAIVGKEQRSFIVRQLMSSIRYVFQIQTIGPDGQTYGPTSSLEFVIEDKVANGNKHVKNRLHTATSTNTRHYEVISIDQSEKEYAYLTSSRSNSHNSGPSSLLTDDYENDANNSAAGFYSNSLLLLALFVISLTNIRIFEL